MSVHARVSGYLGECEAERMRWIKEDVPALNLFLLLLGNTCRHALNKALYPLLLPPTLTPALTLCPSSHHPHPSLLLSPALPNQGPLCPFLLLVPFSLLLFIQVVLI